MTLKQGEPNELNVFLLFSEYNLRTHSDLSDTDIWD